MSEILQAEIVAYSSPKEIFVNGLSRAMAYTAQITECNLIDRFDRRLRLPASQGFWPVWIVEKLRKPVQGWE